MVVIISGIYFTSSRGSQSGKRGFAIFVGQPNSILDFVDSLL
jgi:hypothetical protein